LEGLKFILVGSGIYHIFGPGWPPWPSAANHLNGTIAQTDGGQASLTTEKSVETVVVTGRKPAQDIDAAVSHFVDLHAARNRKT